MAETAETEKTESEKKSMKKEGGVMEIVYFESSSIDLTSEKHSRTVLRGTNGARMGFTLVTEESYGREESHEDQEGLLFIEGEGKALLDGVEYDIRPQTCVLMPAHTRHCFKRNPGSGIIKLFWFHAAN